MELRGVTYIGRVDAGIGVGVGSWETQELIRTGDSSTVSADFDLLT